MEQDDLRRRHPNTGWRRLARSRAAWISTGTLLPLLLAAIVAPWLPLASPVHQFDGQELVPPSGRFWFGTDDFGRDQFARVLFGIRLSLGIGLLAALAAGTLGISAGLMQGFHRGWADELIGRAWDLLMAFPGLILGLVVVTFIKSGVVLVALTAALLNLPLIARIARAGTLAEMEQEYAAAARAAGASSLRILFGHLLPNIFPVAMVQVTLTVAHAMILEAGLSFLGIGIQPPAPSLGNMLRDAQSFLSHGVWLSIFPGAALSVLLLLITFISDVLADAFDPRRMMGSG